MLTRTGAADVADLYGELEDRTTEVMTVNIGPHHPATHGVLRLVVDLEGEVVRDLKPVIGYVHTGIEKSCEDKSYWKVIPFVERMDYVSYFFQMEAYCGAVERLIDLEIPPRAKYLRTIILELNRIHSHLVWLGTTALDLGAISMLWYCFRERDRILDLFEMATGQRMHTRYFQVGGVIEDIPLGCEEKCAPSSHDMPIRVGQYEALLDRNEVFLQRTKGVGIVSRERLLELGVTGPLLRAAGEPWDLRKAFDYLAYPEMDFKIPVGTVGDNYDRYRVRVAEMVESTKIIGQALDGAAGGPVHRRRPQVRAAAALGALDLDGVADPPLQARHRGLPRRPGEIYYAIEGPRGELGCFVLADGSSKPARVHFRDPCFVNLQSLQGHGAGLLRRRHDLQPRHARPDPRRGRSMSPVDGAGVSNPNLPVDSRGHRGPRPPSRDPSRRSRSSHEVDCPAELRERIEQLMSPLPGPQIGLDPGPLGGAGALRLVHAGGDPPGRRGDAGHPGLPRVGRQLLRPAAHRPGSASHRIEVCTNISCWMRGGDELLDAFRAAADGDEDLFVTGFECLGACDIAPMASIDQRYFGPLRAGRGGDRDRPAAGPAPRCCRRSRWRSGRWPATRPTPGRRPGCLTRAETRVLLEHAEDPALRDPAGLQELTAATPRSRRPTRTWSRTRSSRSSKTPACAAAAAPASRWAKRRASCRAGKWPSTSAATPTSPSPAPSRTAS